jgi:hypothetical protein
LAIERTGSFVEVETDGNNTGSVSVTVPADATLMVVGVTGFPDDSSASYFSGGAMTIAGATFTDVAADASSSAFEGMFAYRLSPATGSQTLAWDWSGTANNLGNRALIGYGFYKGIDLGDPVRDTYGGQEGSSPHATDTMTAVSGDWVIAWAFQFQSGATTFAWTNATAAAEFHHSGGGGDPSSHGAFGEATPSGNVQITATVTGSADGGIAAVVFKATAAVAAPPVDRRLTRSTLGLSPWVVRSM